MLSALRKHQRILFIVITIVVITSFSFFGTYSVMTREELDDPVVFTSVDGVEHTRSEMQQMVRFLSSSADQRFLSPGLWHVNFLNDGVVEKDFLQTGMGVILFADHREELRDEWVTRLAWEKKYRPYIHPQASNLSAAMAWDYFSPAIGNELKALQAVPADDEFQAFQHSVRVYFAQKQLPPEFLRRLLQSQQGQSQGIDHDPFLDQGDLAIFGYHGLDDWFGVRYLEYVAQFILNAAVYAEKAGFSVTREEALADLHALAAQSFDIYKNNPQFNYGSSGSYFREQMRRLGIDEGIATHLWQRILLFRRLFYSVGDSVFVSPFMFRQFDKYAGETAHLDLFQLPKQLRLSTMRDLANLEIYLDAVAPRTPGLGLPTHYYSTAEVEGAHPQFVGRQYTLEIATIAKAALEVRVGLREMSDWEMSEENWPVLEKKFVFLRNGAAGTRDQRFALLDALPPETRFEVDAYARSRLVDAHPEWVDAALDKVEPQKVTALVRSAGGTFPVAGVSDRPGFIRLLEAASLAGATEEAGLSQEAATALSHYSDDGQAYARVRVLERDANKQVLTFSEAQRAGIMNEAIDQMLAEAGIHPDDKEAASHWLQGHYSSLCSEMARYVPEGSSCATHRFVPYLQRALVDIQRDMSRADSFVRGEQEADTLESQWKLERHMYKAKRSSTALVDMENVVDMPTGTWSHVYATDSGETYFFKMLSTAEGDETMTASMRQGQTWLSREARCWLMQQMMAAVEEKRSQLPLPIPKDLQ